MAIELPRVLKNMNLFVDGRGYAGRVDEIQLPKLTLKTEEHRAGGMDLPVELDLGMEKLEAQLTISDFDPELFKLFGLLDVSEAQLTLRGAIQAQGQTAQPVVVNLRGGWKELDPGTWKPGDKSTLTVMVAARVNGWGATPQSPCEWPPSDRRRRPCAPGSRHRSRSDLLR